MFEEVIYRQGKFAAFIFEQFFPNGQGPQPIRLINAIREATVVLMGIVLAKVESFPDLPVLSDETVLTAYSGTFDPLVMDNVLVVSSLLS